MKKWTKILAVGACCALGALGMVACGDPDEKPSGGGGGNNCVYYLAGASLGNIFDVEVDGETVSRDWYPDYAKVGDIPESIHFTQKSNNVYELTANLYKSDAFAILTAGQTWTGQIGGDKLDPLTENEADPISSQDNGNGGRNFYVGVAGNYTLTLNTSSGTPVVTYVRNGDPTVAIHVDYNYYIKGDKVTAGNSMYVGYTQFAANSTKDQYTLEIGMQENDKFTFATIMEQDDSQRPEKKSGDFTLATDAETAAAIEVEMTGEGEEQTATGKFKIKGGTGTYEFKIVEDAEDNLTLSAKKKAATLPEYDYYVIGKDPTSEDDLEIAYTKMTLDTETGLYKLSTNLAIGDFVELCVVPKGTAGDKDTIAENIKFAIGKDYATTEYISNQLDTSGGNWVATAADTFTVTIDPVSMIVTVKGENDALIYKVELWGSMIKDWAEAAASAELTYVDETATTVEFVQALKADQEFQFRTSQKGDSKVIQYADMRITSNTDHPGRLDLEEGCFNIADAGQEKSIKCLADGSYRMTVTLDGDGFVVGIKIAKIAYGVYFKGSYGGNTNWALEQCESAAFGENLTAEATITFAAGEEFGIMLYDTADTKKTQMAFGGAKSVYNALTDSNYDYTVTAEGFDLTGSNIKCVTPGTYKVTVTLGTDGKLVSVTVAAVQA